MTYYIGHLMTLRQQFQDILKLTNRPDLASNLEKITLDDFQELVVKSNDLSIFHYLFLTENRNLFDYLIERYQIQKLDLSRLPRPLTRKAPALFLLAIQLYLDPEHFSQYYQKNFDIIHQGNYDSEFYFLFLKSLLGLGIHTFYPDREIVQVILEVADSLYIDKDQKIEERVLSILELLYKTGVRFGMKGLLKHIIMSQMPQVHIYLLRHLSATIIQTAFRKKRKKKMKEKKEFKNTSLFVLKV